MIERTDVRVKRSSLVGVRAVQVHISVPPGDGGSTASLLNSRAISSEKNAGSDQRTGQGAVIRFRQPSGTADDRAADEQRDEPDDPPGE